MNRPSRYALGALIALVVMLVSGLAAAAQGPVRSETLYAGAYKLRVDLYSDPPFTGRPFDFDVLVSADRSVDLHDLKLQAVAIPDPTVNATELPAVIGSGGATPHGFKGVVRMPVRGGWRLKFSVDASGGNNSVSLPLQVAAPTAIPISLAWAIALAPLPLLIAFLIEQRFYLVRLQGAASPQPPIA